MKKVKVHKLISWNAKYMLHNAEFNLDSFYKIKRIYILTLTSNTYGQKILCTKGIEE